MGNYLNTTQVIPTGPVGIVQKRGELRSSVPVQSPTPPASINNPTATPKAPSTSTGAIRRINSDHRIKITVNTRDIPKSIESNILNYDSNSVTSEEEPKVKESQKKVR